MVLLALTGGIAAGKSLAANWFRLQKISVIDADRVARELLVQHPGLLADIRQHFGADCFDEAGQLRRRELGKKVFADPAQLKLLNSLVFPALATELDQRLSQHADQALCVLDAALIYEWGLDQRCDQVWVVTASEKIRVERLIQNRGYSEMEAHERMRSQLDPAVKAQRADCLIDNSGTVAELVTQLEEVSRPLFKELKLDLVKDRTP